MTIDNVNLRISDRCYKLSYRTLTKETLYNGLKISDWQKEQRCTTMYYDVLQNGIINGAY